MATWTDQRPKKSGGASLIDGTIAKRPQQGVNHIVPIVSSEPEGIKPLKTPAFTPAEVKG